MPAFSERNITDDKVFVLKSWAYGTNWFNGDKALNKPQLENKTTTM